MTTYSSDSPKPKIEHQGPIVVGKLFDNFFNKRKELREDGKDIYIIANKPLEYNGHPSKVVASGNKLDEMKLIEAFLCREKDTVDVTMYVTKSMAA